MKILGVDPAIAACGYAVLEDESVIDMGVIETKAGEREAHRLNEIYQDLLTIIAAHKPELIAVEMPIFAGMRTNGLLVPMAYGVISLALEHGAAGVPIVTCKQAQWKAAIVGKGNAKKAEVKAWVQSAYPGIVLKGKDDSRDALCIALYGDRIHALEAIA